MVMIEEDNLSYAWARAFIAATERGVNAIVPLVVTVDMPEGVLTEDKRIREMVDQFLNRFAKLRPCNTTANTIFPVNMWNQNKDRQELYGRYLRSWSRIRRHAGNRYGTYFERMIAYRRSANKDGNSQAGAFNQLEHVISTFNGGNHRASALQVCIFDPFRDHTNQHVRGFPCLQQVNFIPQGTGELTVVGVYATQYLADRAYGNYLGLCALGEFVATGIDRTLTRLICISPKAEIGTPSKGACQELVDQLKLVLPADKSKLSCY